MPCCEPTVKWHNDEIVSCPRTVLSLISVI
jgi:hypothetical protein